MRLVREVTAEEENFRIEPAKVAPFSVIRRDPVKPEPEGTIVLMAFRVTGYDPDCDGSLMARFEQIHFDDPNQTTGWCPNSLGLSPEVDLVVTEDDLSELYEKAKQNSISSSEK